MNTFICTPYIKMLYSNLKTLLLIALCTTILFIVSDKGLLTNMRIYQSNDTLYRNRTPNMVCPIPSLSNRTLPLTALASFPGSGNTWMRHLLQQLTGILTGAIYIDWNLQANGFPGEGRRDGTVVAIKTHASSPTKYKRAILLIRNPYETFLAEFTRRNTGHTGQAVLDHFTKWKTFIQKEVPRYQSFYRSWMQHSDVLPVFYDALKTNLKQELVRISSFLKKAGIDAKPQCALRHPEGNFHRKSNQVQLTFFYNKDQIKLINDQLSQMTEVFSKRFVNITLPFENWKM